jgi:hypothetical protein
LNVIEQWRKRLELKYKLIVNGHEDTEERRGGEKNDIIDKEFLLCFSWFLQKSSCSIFIWPIFMFSRRCIEFIFPVKLMKDLYLG